MLAPQRTHAGVEETRARILAATREIFERNGTRGTTTREVAERAGVNEATLFRHFGSKAALIGAMREDSCGIEAFRNRPDRTRRRRHRGRHQDDRVRTRRGSWPASGADVHRAGRRCDRARPGRLRSARMARSASSPRAA